MLILYVTCSRNITLICFQCSNKSEINTHTYTHGDIYSYIKFIQILDIHVFNLCLGIRNSYYDIKVLHYRAREDSIEATDSDFERGAFQDIRVSKTEITDNQTYNHVGM